MSIRVAINGFGRVGRALMRSAHESGAGIEIVAINDVTDAATLAALLRHDSVYRAFPERSAPARARSPSTGGRSPFSRKQIRHGCHGRTSGCRSRSSPPAASAPVRRRASTSPRARTR